MPLEGAQQRARGRVPQLQRLVLLPESSARAIGRERHRRETATRRCPRRCAAAAPVAASHSFSVLSPLPESSARAIGRERHRVDRSWNAPRRCAAAAPVAASHSFSVLSQLPESTRVPSGENATEPTHLRVPLEGAQQVPGRRVPQLERTVSSCPTAGACRRARTPPSRPSSECPSKVRSSAPVAASHSFSVSVPAAESRRVPSGENATEVTSSSAPRRCAAVRPSPRPTASASCHRCPRAARAIGRERHRA